MVVTLRLIIIAYDMPSVAAMVFYYYKLFIINNLHIYYGVK